MPPQGGQQSEADNSLAPLWITIGVFCLGAFIWYFFKQEILAFVFTIRHYEVDLIAFFIPDNWSQHLQQTQAFINQAKETGFSSVTYNDLINVSTQIGDYLRYPVALMLFGLAGLVYLGNMTLRYKKTHSMKTLLQAHKENWPQIMPVVNLDLVNEDIHKGPWAMALQPVPFAEKYHLIKEETVKKQQSVLEKELPTAKLKKDEARKIFAAQLGAYWSEPEALPIHLRALFAVFAARASGDRDDPTKLLEQIAISANTGKLNFAGTDTLLSKHKDNKLVVNLTKRHAFISTVMPSMLQLAREDGVLPSADFLWLKPVDRRMWFTLNCVGRQTPFPEIAGIFAHWIAEKELQRTLNVPMVEEAVVALEVALKEIVYHPDKEKIK